MKLENKYQLINKENNYNSNTLKYDILKYKGVSNPEQYLLLNKNNTYSYHLLDNIDLGVKCLLKHIEKNNDIYIQIDNDVDGITSASALYLYLKRSCKNNIFYNMQEGKGHGLNISQIPSSVKLVIVPDAGSSQFNEHKILNEKGIDIIVLDHHQCDKYSKNAIVINNQMSKGYKNKQLSGVGIVYKFLLALDEELWQDYANDYLDLVALGNIADLMDVKSHETKYYIDKGLRNIKNLMLKELIFKQNYSMKGIVNINNIAFYIAPCINALIRCGTQEDKLMLFEAFSRIDTNRTFEYENRKTKQVIKENLFQHMARICCNAKSRQNSQRDKLKKQIVKNIKKYNLNKNKIIIYNGTSTIHKNFTGLIAMTIADIYNKPCLILRKKQTDNKLFCGSGRNVDNCEIPSLKVFLENSNLVKSIIGHDNAHGVEIENTNVPKLIKYANHKLKAVNFKKGIDFKIPFEELSDDFILIVDEMSDLWGMGLKEPLIYIENVYVNKKYIKLLGKKKNTIAFKTEDIKFIKFNEKEETYNKIMKVNNDIAKFNIVGKCNVNTYNNEETLQIQIEEFEINN